MPPLYPDIQIRMDYQHHSLPNGLQIVHRPSATEVAHLGIVIKAGSRDEQEHEHGLAHLIEHCLFKGTTHRKAYHILTRLEDVGAEINAYTSKEETCIYASFLPVYYERTIELLTDILFNSIFPPKEVEKEKEVVIDEIHSYQELPYETVNEHFELKLFPNNQLGKSILGTPKGIKKQSIENLLAFYKLHYQPENMILSSFGDIPFRKLCTLTEKYFSKAIKPDLAALKNFYQDPLLSYKPFDAVIKGKTSQSHCIIGAPAYSCYHPDKYSIALLNNILGGPAMSSRLSYSLREKLGYAYNVESNYSAFTDSGQLLIYFATDYQSLEKASDRVYLELKGIREKKLGDVQLYKAKQQYIGQMALSMESNLNQMISAAKSMMIYDRIEELSEIEAKIESITSENILETANEVFNENSMSRLVLQNERKTK